MKFKYIVFLFVVSIMYSNFFDTYKLQKKYNRMPASQETSCFELLKQFYPNQTDDFLKKRIQNNLDFHSFYRAFPPLYYETFFKMKTDFLQKLLMFKGTLAGDAHVENFGVVLREDGKGMLTINDIDDAAQAPVILDAFRHYISSNIVSKVSWKKYLEVYRQGLDKADWQYSKHVQSLLDNAQDETDKFLKESISLNPEIKFIKFKGGKTDLSPDEATQVLTSLSQKFKGVKIFDKYKRIKPDGGSAGLDRYEVLAQLDGDKKILWLDIKELDDNSFNKVTHQSPLSFDEKLNIVKRDIYRDHLNNSFDLVQIKKKTFYIRRINQFALGIKTENYDTTELADVILDEVYALGRLHRESLTSQNQSLDKYSSALSDLKDIEVENFLQKLQDEMNVLYKNSKN